MMSGLWCQVPDLGVRFGLVWLVVAEGIPRGCRGDDISCACARARRCQGEGEEIMGLNYCHVHYDARLVDAWGEGR